MARETGQSTLANVTDAVVADVATGSADNMIRVFTADATRALQGDELIQVQEASLLLAERGDGCAVPPPSFLSGEGGAAAGGLPSVSDMGNMVGEMDGHLSAFGDENGGAKVRLVYV